MYVNLKMLRSAEMNTRVGSSSVYIKVHKACMYIYIFD